jgi:hypothetical protein
MGDARDGDLGGLIISEPVGRVGIGTLTRFPLDVGDRIGRGDAGGDNGTEVEFEPVKNGNGAAETSSSRVNAPRDAELRIEELERTGLEILAPGPILRKFIKSWNANLHTSTRKNNEPSD